MIKKHWIRAEESASVVYEIGLYMMEDFGSSQIARKLTEREILPLAAYYTSKGIKLPAPKEDPEQQYRNWYRAKSVFDLREVQFVEVEPQIESANMIAQHSIRTTSLGIRIRYDALGKCLFIVTERAILKQASIHMPRIGCGLAGGTWYRVEPMIPTNTLSKRYPSLWIRYHIIIRYNNKSPSLSAIRILLRRIF